MRSHFLMTTIRSCLLNLWKTFFEHSNLCSRCRWHRDQLPCLGNKQLFNYTVLFLSYSHSYYHRNTFLGWKLRPFYTECKNFPRWGSWIKTIDPYGAIHTRREQSRCEKVRIYSSGINIDVWWRSRSNPLLKVTGASNNVCVDCIVGEKWDC